MLCQTTYNKFGMTKQSDFMRHTPVSPEEMKYAIVPAENDWRWDFSAGYRHSRWNRAIFNRVVKESVEGARALGELDAASIASIDLKWLEQQLLGQMERMRTEWARPQPRPRLHDGRMETGEEAAARAMQYLIDQHNKNKSTSSKTRVRVHK